MQVNFNNLRLNAIKDYNALIKTLNRGLCEDIDMTRVVVPAEDIQRQLDNLRNDLVTLGCLEEPGNPDCQVVLTDKVPLL